MFKLEIETDNAAFEGVKGFENELRRLLYKTAAYIAAGKYEGTLLDINGNTVGSFKLEA